MADFVTALLDRCEAAGTAAGDRFFLDVVPQNAAFPYVRLSVISDPREEHLKGYNGQRITRVQFDCMAKSVGEARAIGIDLVPLLSAPDSVGGVNFGHSKCEGPTSRAGAESPAGYTHRQRVEAMISHDGE